MPSQPPMTDDATELLPRSACAAGPSAELAPGTQLGVYEIRALLGEGGMGRVYLAEQLRPVRRKVALKLIREQVASPLARAYFDVERQALAQMQHPSIAQVFDAGTTEDGHPYLAMEWVEGEPLAQFCREHALDRSQRIALFKRICHGVQHAHQKGIIHRDLKPANVLVREVDGVPLPIIIDFGIAIGGGASADGVVEVSVRVDEQAGTLAYMSPEQSARGGRDLDTRSDVYALGVMLCELLTGCDAASLASAPHASRKGLHATLLAAVEDAAGGPPAPTDSLLAAARNLPASLRAILRKALATEREDRYPSASALAEDLERYRANRPLIAIAPTRWYLARTFVLRHRLGLVAAAMIAVALVAGIVLALQGRNAARESARLAQVEANKAAQVSEFVRGMLAGIDPNRAKGMDRSLMRLLLDSAAQRADKELVGQPAVRADIERTIAGSYAAIGEGAIASEHYATAVAAAAAAGMGASARARLLASSALNLDNQGHAKEALVQAEQALGLVASLPADDRDRLVVESVLAGVEYNTGATEQARERYQRVLALQRRVAGVDSDETLDTMNGLVTLESETAHLDVAQPLALELVARCKARFGAEHSRTLSAINSLAVVYAEQKRFADAQALLEPELPIYERVFGKDHPLTLRLVSNLGSFIRQQGHNEEARPYYERALALAIRLYGEVSPATVIAESNLSLLLRDAGDLAGAERHARDAARNADAAFGDNPMRAIMSREYATILIRLHRYPEAQAQLDHAWDIFAQAEGFGPGHPRAQDVVDSAVELYTAWPHPERLAMWKKRKTR